MNAITTISLSMLGIITFISLFEIIKSYIEYKIDMRKLRNGKIEEIQNLKGFDFINARKPDTFYDHYKNRDSHKTFD